MQSQTMAHVLQIACFELKIAAVRDSVRWRALKHTPFFKNLRPEVKRRERVALLKPNDEQVSTSYGWSHVFTVISVQSCCCCCLSPAHVCLPLRAI